jgi:vancomycin permeability regulator SanA
MPFSEIFLHSVIAPKFPAFYLRISEIGARVKMWLDVNILDTKPKHLGDRIGLPE